MRCISTTLLQFSFPATTNNNNNNNNKTMAHLNLLINGEKLCLAFEFKHKHSSNSNRLSRIGDNYKMKNQIRFRRCSRICGLGNRSNSYSAPAEELVNGGDVDDDDYDYDEDGEFGNRRDELTHFRGLVLDISYRPVNIVCWKRAICLEFMEKADVLEYYEQTVNSPSGSFYIPAVLRVPNLLQVVKRRRVKQTLSRKSIFFRDAFTCQYCSSRESLTIDHVVPITRGGEWEWENLVTACARCNSRKGPKTLEEANMKLLKVPKAPKESDILAIPLTTAAMKTLKKKKGLPNEWRQYLGL